MDSPARLSTSSLVLAIGLTVIVGVAKWQHMLAKGWATWIYIAIGAVWIGYYGWRISRHVSPGQN